MDVMKTLNNDTMFGLIALQISMLCHLKNESHICKHTVIVLAVKELDVVGSHK